MPTTNFLYLKHKSTSKRKEEMQRKISSSTQFLYGIVGIATYVVISVGILSLFLQDLGARIVGLSIFMIVGMVFLLWRATVPPPKYDIPHEQDLHLREQVGDLLDKLPTGTPLIHSAYWEMPTKAYLTLVKFIKRKEGSKDLLVEVQILYRYPNRKDEVNDRFKEGDIKTVQTAELYVLTAKPIDID